WNASSACSPVSASSTTQPSSSRAILTAVRMRSSSSTVRMRVLTPPSFLTARQLRRTRPPTWSIQLVDHRFALERGEEGELPGTALGAVVQPVRHVAAQVAAARQRGGAFRRERGHDAEVDVDAARRGVELAADAVDEHDADLAVELTLEHQGDVVGLVTRVHGAGAHRRRASPA